MPALNFPNNPAVNDTYIAAGYTYKWDGTKWMTVQSGEKSMNQIMDEHKASVNQHSISGVTGLREELDAIEAAGGNAVADLDARMSVVEGKIATLEQRKSTCLVNATGTGAPHETVVAQLPANITVNTRYVLPNPFGNYTPVICWAEVFVDGKWAHTGFIYATSGNVTSGFGVSASYVQGEGIVAQTGGNAVVTHSAHSGSGHGISTIVASAPCRVFVRKLEA